MEWRDQNNSNRHANRWRSPGCVEDRTVKNWRTPAAASDRTHHDAPGAVSRYNRSVTAHQASAPWPRIDVAALLRQCTLKPAPPGADESTREALLKKLADEAGVRDSGGYGDWTLIPRIVPLPDAQRRWSRSAHCDGAAMLPVMRPNNGGSSLYFQLGVQRFRADSSLRGNRLSLFGGHRCHAGEDAPAVAAREFIEETLGCVGFTTAHTAALRGPHGASLLPFETRVRAELAERLRSGHHLMRLRLFYTRKAIPRFYDVFVVLIPWDPEAMPRFRAVRAALRGERGALYERLRRLRGTSRVCDTMGRIRPCFTEMDELTLWSGRQLRCAIANNHNTVFDFVGAALQCRADLAPILKQVLHMLEHMTSPQATWPPELVVSGL